MKSQLWSCQEASRSTFAFLQLTSLPLLRFLQFDLLLGKEAIRKLSKSWQKLFKVLNQQLCQVYGELHFKASIIILMPVLKA